MFSATNHLTADTLRAAPTPRMLDEMTWGAQGEAQARGGLDYRRGGGLCSETVYRLQVNDALPIVG